MEDLFEVLFFLAFVAFGIFGRANKRRREREDYPGAPRGSRPPTLERAPTARPSQPAPLQPSTRNWPPPPLAQPQRPALAGEGARMEGRSSEGVRTKGVSSEGRSVEGRSGEGVRSEGFGSGEGPEADERLRPGETRFRRLEDRIPDEFEVTEFDEYDGLQTGLEYREVPVRHRRAGVPVNIHDDLADPQRVAEAIVLAEVLGPPLSKRGPYRRRIWP